MHFALPATVLALVALASSPIMAKPLNIQEVNQASRNMQSKKLPTYTIGSSFDSINTLILCSGNYFSPPIPGCISATQDFTGVPKFVYYPSDKLYADGNPAGWLATPAYNTTLTPGVEREGNGLNAFDWTDHSKVKLEHVKLQLNFPWLGNPLVFAFQIKLLDKPGQCVSSDAIWGRWQYPNRPVSTRTCAIPQNMEEINDDSDDTDTTTFMRTLFFATDDTTGMTHISNVYDIFRRLWTCLDNQGRTNPCKANSEEQNWAYHAISQ
ncbi:MAG: hypothetical protein DHS80DRAFT_22685 [Piptocephalis tieghemiana]|nr:MAG: hypothetical protein DHS80DRAFT_22685 [Piptocephalis tieghemiana]